MADTDAKQKFSSALLKTKKRPTSCRARSKTEGSEVTAPQKPASAPVRCRTDELLSQEEQYKLMNAELEARTADLVRQAERFMRDGYGARAATPPPLLSHSSEDESSVASSEESVSPDPVPKAGTRTRARVSRSPHSSSEVERRRQRRAATNTATVKKVAGGDSVVDQLAEFSKNVRGVQEKLEQEEQSGELDAAGGPSDSHTRLLKARLRVMQEEMDQLTYEYYKKDDEMGKLSKKVKDLEEERARLQRANNVQQTQLDKQRGLAEQAAGSCSALQLQVAALQKEVESLRRSQKQAAGVHGTAELRLNRALEEVEKLKTQLGSVRQSSQDKMNQEQQRGENLQAENRMLKKQKAELVVGFKTQLKLIDVLKRQKAHFEAAKLLSFTEEEFLQALDWGKA